MTEKIHYNWQGLISILGGVTSYLLGEWDFLLKTLIALIILDYITGICKGIYSRNLSSKLGIKGIVKKVFMLSVVAVANLIQTTLGNSIPIREIIITFYIVNESISILENASDFIPIPAKLYEVIHNIKDENK